MLLIKLPSVRVITPPDDIVIVPPLLNVPANKFKLVIVNPELVVSVVPTLLMVSVFRACAPSKVTPAGSVPEPPMISEELASALKLPFVRAYAPLMVNT